MCIFSKILVSPPHRFCLDELSMDMMRLKISESSLEKLNFEKIRKQYERSERHKLSDVYKALLLTYEVSPILPKETGAIWAIKKELTEEKLEKVQDVFFRSIAEQDSKFRSFFYQNSSNQQKIWGSLNLYFENLLTRHEALSAKEVRSIDDHCPFGKETEEKKHTMSCLIIFAMV